LLLERPVDTWNFRTVRPLSFFRSGGVLSVVKQTFVLLFAVGILLFTGNRMELSITNLVEGIPHIFHLLSRMFPPDISYLPRLVDPMLETLEIALWGTTGAVILALPLSFFAARNLTPHPVAYAIARGILNTQRGVSEMVFALIFVAAVGLGAFPGVLALAVHSSGQLGKFFAEAMENVEPGPLEALQATGATKLQTIAFAVWPQVLPELVTYTLYRWEVDVRAAFVLGIVGAGGLGFELIMAMRLFKYQETLAILLLLIVVVMIIDRVSAQIRARIISGS
jgi:phosphonate transport system permease protein